MPRTRRNWLPWALLIVLIVGVYLGSVALQARGTLRLPFELPLLSLFKQPPGEPGRTTVPEGTIAVPVAATAVPAYTKIRRDHVWDSKRGQIRVVYLPRDQVPEGVFTDLADIVGRVLDHDKQPGYVFTEKDFYPKGTREGVVAGVPADKMMMLIEAKKVAGLHGLRPGDRFDVIETIPVDTKRSQLPKGDQGVYADAIALEMQLSNWKQQAEVRVIVRGASVVSPVAMRAQPSVSTSLSRGKTTRNVPIQELYIAVDPNEVAPLSRAMAVGSDVRAVVRSGHAASSKGIAPTDLRPKNPFSKFLASSPAGGASKYSLVETIGVGERRLITVPSHVDRPQKSLRRHAIGIVPSAGPDSESEE